MTTSSTWRRRNESTGLTLFRNTKWTIDLVAWILSSQPSTLSEFNMSLTFSLNIRSISTRQDLLEQEMLEAGHSRREIRQILEGMQIRRDPDRHGDAVYVEAEESSSNSSAVSQIEELGKSSQLGNLDFEMSEASLPDEKWELSDAGSVGSRQFRLSVSSLDE